MKQWLVRAGIVGLGGFIGSLVLENLTSLTIWAFVAHVHDVQFAFLITVISLLGSILGGVSVMAFLLAKAQRFKVAACLDLVFGGLVSALCVWVMVGARQAFDPSPKPLIDALAYVGFTLVWSIFLVLWGVLLLFGRVSKTT